MPQAKPITIRKLRAEKLHLLEALVKAWYAAGLTDDEVVQKVREEFTEAPSLTDAIMKSLRNPVRAGFTIGSGPPAGAGTLVPSGQVTDSMQKRRDKVAAAEEALKKHRADVRSRRIDR